MSALTKILTGAAGLAAAVGFASPAAAQYYPGYGYGGNQNVLGTIINGVLGGGQYGYGNSGYRSNTRYAVQQCAAAVQQRLGGGYNQGYGGYGGYGSYGGYGQGYGGGRVLAITHADRHGGGTVKVKGLATSGMNAGYNQGYGYGGYNQAQADLKFSCRTDYRGRIIDLDIDRRNRGYYRGY